jgi:hypothetical protein
MQEAINKQKVPNHPKEITIIVNARPKPWLDKDISFQQVVVLAFGTFPQDPSTAYTITYKGGESKKEGSMILDDIIKVKDKMIFNVTATNKS